MNEARDNDIRDPFRLRPVQKITLAAMLIVLDIVATHVIRTPAIPGFPFLRVSLGPALVIYASLLLGPFYGAVVGAAGDILGIVIFTGIEGQINPLITVVYGLLGILPWCLLQLTKHMRSFFKRRWVFYIFLFLLPALLAVVFYAIPYTAGYFRSGFGDAAVWVMPLILGLTVLFDIIGCVSLYFTNRHYEAMGEALSGLPSCYEVAFICLVSEVVLMVLLKPLAFYLFYNFLASDPFPISYGWLVACMLVFSGVDVMINTHVSYWLLAWTRRFMKSFGLVRQRNG
jgi:hypothetical protein